MVRAHEVRQADGRWLTAVRHDQWADGRRLSDDRDDQRAGQRPHLDDAGGRWVADSRGDDQRPDDGTAGRESLDPDILVPQLGVRPDELRHHADAGRILTQVE